MLLRLSDLGISGPAALASGRSKVLGRHSSGGLCRF